MNKDKIVNGYYQPNITTSRGENITYTAKYAIDKLQQEIEQLKEVIEEVREYIIKHQHISRLSFKDGKYEYVDYELSCDAKEMLQILDKVKENK